MRIALLTTSALVTLALAAPASAQQAEDEGASADTIVVTARKREENLLDVPLPVSVTTAEQLKRDQIYTITDLQRTSPSLEVSQTSGGEVNGGARLRGLGTGVFNASVSPSVAFVVDQVPQGNLTFPLMFDLGQVEVLRGPQGTLFGQGASAGVINISTVAPSLDRASVSGGVDFADNGSAGSEVGELTVRAAANVPLNQTIAARVAVYYRKEEGLQRNSQLGKDNASKDFGMRGRLLIDNGEGLTVNLGAERTSQSIRGWNFFAIAIAPNGQPNSAASLGAYTNPAGCNIPVITERAKFYCEDTQARMRNTASSLNGRIDLELSDSLTLTSVTAWRELDRETDTVNFSRRTPVAARNENIESESQQFSHETRLAYSSDGIDLVAGAMYSQFKLETTPIINRAFGQTGLGQRTGFSVCHNLGFFCPVPVALSYEKTKNDIFAVFADATVAITDTVDLFGGLRYSKYDNTTGVGANVLTATRTSRIKDNNVSGRIGISHKPNPDTTLFVSYARGYKPPAIVVPTIATDPVVNLAPEKADAIELGGKLQSGPIQYSANIFWSRVGNFQAQSSIFNQAGALISVTQNISKVVSKGFEFNAFGRLTDNLSFNAGYQFNDVEFPKGFIGNDGVSLAGKQFINAPKHKLTLSGEYSLPVSDGAEIFLNANMVYKTKVLLGQYGGSEYRYPAHAIVNTGLGLRDPDGGWKAAIFVRNLTKQREPTAYLASDLGGARDGGIRAWPVAGLTARVVGLSVDFAF